MILLLIPLAGIALGVGLWAALRALGSLNVLGVEPVGVARERHQPRERRERRERGERLATGNIRERIDNLPTGVLIGVIAACAVWTLGWLVVLVAGLSMLS